MTTHRVAIFTETFLPRVDGIVNTLRWTIHGLTSCGWQAAIVAPQGNTQAVPGVTVIGSPSITFPLYPEVRLGYPTSLVWRELDRFRPDVIHLAGPVTNGLGGLRYALDRHLPVVSSYHTALPDYARLYGLWWLAPWAWRGLRAIHNSGKLTLCPSRVTIDQLRAHGFDRLELWSRGVDADLFKPERRSAAWRARLGAGWGDVLVLYVGRLAREKKLDRLAAALRRLDGVHLTLIGDGPDRERLQNVFAGLPVTFAGVLRDRDLAAAYAAGDVFAFPSDTETFGNAVLEAMASGLPVVAPNVGGHTDLISHGTTGLLFEPKDIDSFAEHIATYRDDALLRSRHGGAGLAVARARTWPHQIEMLIQHYETTMGQPADQSLAPLEKVVA
jgi:glycosyltransferase involved in cell wall biosynthesis